MANRIYSTIWTLPWIDHENAIASRQEQDDNKLVRMVEVLDDFIDVERAAIEAARSLNPSGVDEAAKEIDFPDDYARLVRQRLETLPQRIIERFPEPEDDLFNT